MRKYTKITDRFKLRPTSNGLGIQVIDPTISFDDGVLMHTEWYGFGLSKKPTRGQAKAIVTLIVKLFNEK